MPPVRAPMKTRQALTTAGSKDPTCTWSCNVTPSATTVTAEFRNVMEKAFHPGISAAISADVIDLVDSTVAPFSACPRFETLDSSAYVEIPQPTAGPLRSLLASQYESSE
eukprot:1612096-Prymnesium_polylepis.1